jgi:hypothetical protein
MSELPWSNPDSEKRILPEILSNKELGLSPEQLQKLNALSEQNQKEIIDQIKPLLANLRKMVHWIDNVVWEAIKTLLEKWAKKLIPPTRP